MKRRHAEAACKQQGVASPYVMLELLAHLADPADTGFADCLSGVCALQRHCELDENVGQLGMLGELESHIARGLFGVTPIENQGVTQELAWTCLAAQHNPTPELLNSIRPRLLKLRDWVDNMKQTFIEDMRTFVVGGLDPSAKDWRPLKANSAARRRALRFLESEDAPLDLASLYVLKAAVKADVSELTREEIAEKANQVLTILQAAGKVGAGGAVVTLLGYKAELGIATQPSVSTRNSSGASASAVW